MNESKPSLQLSNNDSIQQHSTVYGVRGSSSSSSSPSLVCVALLTFFRIFKAFCANEMDDLIKGPKAIPAAKKGTLV
jgi:hypothetical protein